jgi:D-alanine-D-alanine ligase
MDKAHMKAMFVAAGLEVGPFEVITALQWEQDQDGALARIANLGLPVFVKPARAGSSVGITKVKNYASLLEAIALAQSHDPKIIVEAGLEGVREIECGVMSYADGPRASVIAEIIIQGDHEFYDYAAKYVDDSALLSVPAEIEPALVTRIQETAKAAFLALDSEGLARVDMFLQDQRIVLNEINTMPGFTPISMFPRTWAATGLEYPELVDHLIQDALRRGVGLR